MQPEPGSDDEEEPALPARISQPLQDVEAEPGETALFEVKITGNPVPKVEWYFDGKELAGGEKYKIDAVGNRYSLNVCAVSKEDCGEYAVVVFNDVGRDTGKALLSIKGIYWYRIYAL